MRLNDLARDEEAEPDAARARARHSVELLEDAVEVLAGDALARVRCQNTDGTDRPAAGRRRDRPSGDVAAGSQATRSR